jgi:hypothetical protein
MAPSLLPPTLHYSSICLISHLPPDKPTSSKIYSVHLFPLANSATTDSMRISTNVVYASYMTTSCSWKANETLPMDYGTYLSNRLRQLHQHTRYSSPITFMKCARKVTSSTTSIVPVSVQYRLLGSRRLQQDTLLHGLASPLISSANTFPNQSPQPRVI